MNVTFECPACQRPDRVILKEPVDWQCTGCDCRLRLEVPAPTLSECVVCGNRELYKKKDFPHWLGMTLLVGACLLSVYTYGFYEKWLTWALLLGTALIDGGLYLWVGDAVVCYRCQAHYRDVQAQAHHQPHELLVAERYRQERIRKEQLKNVNQPR